MAESMSIAELLPEGWASLEFEPFSDGVEICRLFSGGPDVALLRYCEGASVRRHRHTGLETILVLSGSQSDERGTYPAGSIVFNPVGTDHRVWSTDGCTVLIQWEKPVEFLE
ncbi:ChrR-like anti-ECFsigma factor [Aliiruegeria haliotis]|uniref:ChrR-like anti-ECFsigma factor n=1 Tax=Aliiruegeria haliotis TaxID=1280846 RepID=A0A2T0RYS4_9RHOB|nr:cupin domain-containing protein [Aliiruegeria haliotis]PRY26318.1 ChrR-like anti-ECFsigma factor [Aliiruegeria haliotis]